MKIQAIRGKNLASLADTFELDFTAEPLRSSGLFVITGPTGSGKSTLLDALCLALYNKAPRLENLEQQAVKDRQTGQELQQSDSRHILRRNVVSGYAEVDFEAVDTHIYRARWSVRRAYNKIDGRLGESAMELFDLTEDRPVPGKKSEILQQIVRLVGLSYDQFTRTVLLSQGGFSAFLKAEKKKKSELLEKLTGTEIYSRISMAIYAKYVESERMLGNIRDRVEMLALMPEEVWELRKQERAEKQAEWERLNRERADKEAKLAWFRQKELLEKSLQEAQASLESIEAELHTVEPERLWLQAYDAAQSVRDVFLQWQSDRDSIRMLVGELRSEESCLDEKKRASRERNQRLETRLDALHQFENRWEQGGAEREQMLRNETNLQHCADSLAKVEKERADLAGTVKKGRDKMAFCTEKLKELQEQQVALDEFLEKSRAWIPVLENLPVWTGYFERYAQLKQKESEYAGRLHTLQEEQAQVEKEKNTIESRLGQLENETPAYIGELRRHLAEGVPCPVCGSLHHPFSAASQEAGKRSVAGDFAELEQQKKKLETELAALRPRQDRLVAEMAVAGNMLTQIREEKASLIEKTESVFSAWKDWNSLLEKGSLKTALSRFADRWKAQMLRREELDKECRILESEKSVIGQQQLEWEDKLASVGEESAKIRDEYQRLLQTAEPGKVRRLEEAYAEERQVRQSEVERLRKEVAEEKSGLDLLEGQILRNRKILAERRTSLIESNRRIAEWLAARSSEDRPEDLGSSRRRLAGLFAVPAREVSLRRQALQQILDRKTSVLSLWQERSRQLLAHERLPERPDTSEADVAGLAEEIAQIAVSMDTCAKSLRELDSVLKAEEEKQNQYRQLQSEWQRCRVDYAGWERLKRDFGSAEGDAFKNIAQQYNLDLLLEYANRHLETIASRYALSRLPGSLGLQITDRDMLNEVRPVQTLSGGETFLVSLALALALASMSSMQMKVDSLFIDEGFGSLDSDTLNVALNALENLQMQGKTVGIISHVADLTEKIACKVKLVRQGEGRSRVVVEKSL